MLTNIEEGDLAKASGPILTQTDINRIVLAHDRDIRAVKAIIGFLVAIGTFVLMAFGAIQGFFHK